MQVSDKLAREILTILLFHGVTIVSLSTASLHIWLRGKKTQLLRHYLAVAGLLLIWMLAKVLKTVAPNESLRWGFIVLQYFGIQFLGVALVLFARSYAGKPALPRKTQVLLALAPAAGFLIVLTNPLHMGFYAHFDFYRDRFGPLFFPIQLISYAYILASILLLAKGYLHQPGFKGRKGLARLTAAAVLVPLLCNVYYILYKLIKPLPWIFPFAAFDFTPIAGSVSLLLFMIPALQYRFFDISPITLHHLYAHLPQGIAFMHPSGRLQAHNRIFAGMFGPIGRTFSAADIAEVPGMNEAARQSFLRFLSDGRFTDTHDLHLPDGRSFRVGKHPAGRRTVMLRVTDISAQTGSQRLLEEKNRELVALHEKLDGLARASRELSAAGIRHQVSQDMHDILGHSLTVVLGSAELALRDGTCASLREKLGQMDELLSNSVQDLKNTLQGKETDWHQSSLTRAIAALENDSIAIDFSVQGQVYELRRDKTEAVYALCREAVTNAIRHGSARTIHLVLRYKPTELEVFAIDDGMGCVQIKKHFGLSGIEQRIGETGGHVLFASNGEKGFTLHAFLPKD